jgi:hypothetical protein
MCATISRTYGPATANPVSTGSTIIAAHVNTDLDTVYTEFNGSIAGSSGGAAVNIQQGTISNADLHANAAIALTKLANGALPAGVTVASANITNDTIVDADINSAAAITLTKLANGALPAGVTVASANITNDTIVNADINSAAAIVQSKIVTSLQNIAQITANVTAPASNTGTVVDITGLEATGTSITGRTTRITGFCRLYNQGAGDVLTLYIYEGVTLLAKTSINTGGANQVLGAVVIAMVNGDNAAHTYKLAMSTAGGVGGINCEAAATYPSFISIETI